VHVGKVIAVRHQWLNRGRHICINAFHKSLCPSQFCRLVFRC